MESVTKFILHFLLAILYVNLYVKCDPHNGGNFASIDNVSSYREENLLDVSHLKGKDIRSIGWIQSSFANEGFQEANLPKRALKEYLNTKDRLFVAYMDTCPYRKGFVNKRSLKLCYKYIDGRNGKPWIDADKACQKEEGKLFNVDNVEKTRHIQHYIRHFNDAMVYVHGNQSDVTYNHSGIPIDRSDGMFLALNRSIGFDVQVTDGQNPYAFICEIHTP